MRLNYLESIGYCKALCQDTGTVVTGRLVYFGAGRYALQQGIDLSVNGDTYAAFRTDNIFVNITTVCEFTKMYSKDDTPVFNNDIIQDELGNTYYVYWDQIKSAYLYLALTNDITTAAPNLDITKTTVVGNIILDDVNGDLLYGEIN